MEATVEQQELADLRALLAAQENLGQYAEIDVLSAEVLLLNTAKKLLTAGRAGTVLEFVTAVLILKHGGTDYLTNGDITIQSETTGTVLSDTMAGADFLLASGDTVRVLQALSADAQLDPGEGLVLSVATGNPTAGDGDVKVKMIYRLHQTGL